MNLDAIVASIELGARLDQQALAVRVVTLACPVLWTLAWLMRKFLEGSGNVVWMVVGGLLWVMGVFVINGAVATLSALAAFGVTSAGFYHVAERYREEVGL